MISFRYKKLFSLTAWSTALVLMIPVLVMLWAGVSASSELLVSLWQSVLPEYIINTLLLGLMVSVLALIFGVISAAIITQTNVIGKNVLRWLLLLPLAMPAYLVAYLYTDLFDYAGPVQRALRAWFAWQSPYDYWFFDIRTLPGAAVILALVLFPYVYMLARTAFEHQDQHLFDASHSLGFSARKTFFVIALPLARPAIAVAVTLVLMETLADFATVQYFAVNTLTTAIYDTWLGYGDLPAANALASVLMLFVFIVVVMEQRSRHGQRHQSNRPYLQQEHFILSRLQQVLAMSFCWCLVIAGFLLPLLLLVIMIIDYGSTEQLLALVSTGKNSLKVACYVATLAVLLALLFGLYGRLSSDKLRALPLKISAFGYAVPGTVLAMAMLATFGPLDHWLNDIAISLNIEEPGLIFSGTIFALITAYLVRFSAIANGTIVSGIEQIPHSLDLAPASLGVNQGTSILRIHLPLLKPSILVAWLLVFVEAMKELPAVLLLRPFNFDTLSTQVYQLIADEMLEQGALGAVLIVLFGLLPIIWLNKSKEVA